MQGITNDRKTKYLKWSSSVEYALAGRRTVRTREGRLGTEVS